MKNQPLKFLDFVSIGKYLLENMGLPLELNLLLKKQQKVEVLKNLLPYQPAHLGYNFLFTSNIKVQNSFDFKLFRNQNFSLTHMISRTYQPLIFHLLH